MGGRPARSSCSSDLDRFPTGGATGSHLLPCSTASIGPDRSCSAAGMSCCRCCRRRSCRQGWVDNDTFSRRLRRGAGRAGTTVHLLGLSRHGHGAGAERLASGLVCLVGIFLPSFFLAIGPLPSLELVSPAPGDALGAERRQCGRCRALAGGALQSGLDQRVGAAISHSGSSPFSASVGGAAVAGRHSRGAGRPLWLRSFDATERRAARLCRQPEFIAAHRGRDSGRATTASNRETKPLNCRGKVFKGSVHEVSTS